MHAFTIIQFYLTIAKSNNSNNNMIIIINNQDHGRSLVTARKSYHLRVVLQLEKRVN